MTAKNISKVKADEMIADLKERLGNRLADLSVADDIIRGWLNDHIGIADIGVELECSPMGTILDTGEGII